MVKEKHIKIKIFLDLIDFFRMNLQNDYYKSFYKYQELICSNLDKVKFKSNIDKSKA